MRKEKMRKMILGMMCTLLFSGFFSCSGSGTTEVPEPVTPTEEYQKPLAVTNNVVAHRGAYKKNNVPHNSLASLWEAINLRLYASECDIHITKDEKVVVFHDDVFQGLDIDKSTYAELKAAGKLANGEDLPLFEDYVKAALQGKYTKIWVDVKTLDNQYGGDANSIKAGEAAAQIVRDLKAKYFVEFIVGKEAVLTKCITAARGDFPVAYMGNSSPATYQSKGYTWTNQTIANFYPDNATKIADFKSRKIRVSTYNADDVTTIKWFVAQGVDQICSNDPELVLKVLRGEI